MNKTVTVYDDDTAPYSARFPDRTFADFVTWVNTLLLSIPEGYRDSAQICLHGESMKFEVFYERAMTPEEIDEDRAKALQSAERQRQHELAQLRQLQAKYPEAK